MSIMNLSGSRLSWLYNQPSPTHKVTYKQFFQEQKCLLSAKYPFLTPHQIKKKASDLWAKIPRNLKIPNRNSSGTPSKQGKSPASLRKSSPRASSVPPKPKGRCLSLINSLGTPSKEEKSHGAVTKDSPRSSSVPPKPKRRRLTLSGRKEELTFEMVRSKKQGIGDFEMDFCQLDSSTPIKPQGGSGDYEKRSKRVASLFDQAVRRDQPKPCLESPDLTFVQDVSEKTYKESMRCPSTFYKTPEIIEDVHSFSQTSILKRDKEDFRKKARVSFHESEEEENDSDDDKEFQLAQLYVEGEKKTAIKPKYGGTERTGGKSKEVAGKMRRKRNKENDHSEWSFNDFGDADIAGKISLSGNLVKEEHSNVTEAVLDMKGELDNKYSKKSFKKEKIYKAENKYRNHETGDAELNGLSGFESAEDNIEVDLDSEPCNKTRLPTCYYVPKTMTEELYADMRTPNLPDVIMEAEEREASVASKKRRRMQSVEQEEPVEADIPEAAKATTNLAENLSLRTEKSPVVKVERCNKRRILTRRLSNMKQSEDQIVASHDGNEQKTSNIIKGKTPKSTRGKRQAAKLKKRQNNFSSANASEVFDFASEDSGRDNDDIQQSTRSGKSKKELIKRESSTGNTEIFDFNSEESGKENCLTMRDKIKSTKLTKKTRKKLSSLGDAKDNNYISDDSGEESSLTKEKVTISKKLKKGQKINISLSSDANGYISQDIEEEISHPLKCDTISDDTGENKLEDFSHRTNVQKETNTVKKSFKVKKDRKKQLSSMNNVEVSGYVSDDSAKKNHHTKQHVNKSDKLIKGENIYVSPSCDASDYIYEDVEEEDGLPVTDVMTSDNTSESEPEDTPVDNGTNVRKDTNIVEDLTPDNIYNFTSLVDSGTSEENIIPNSQSRALTDALDCLKLVFSQDSIPKLDLSEDENESDGASASCLSPLSDIYEMCPDESDVQTEKVALDVHESSDEENSDSESSEDDNTLVDDECRVPVESENSKKRHDNKEHVNPKISSTIVTDMESVSIMTQNGIPVDCLQKNSWDTFEDKFGPYKSPRTFPDPGLLKKKGRSYAQQQVPAPKLFEEVPGENPGRMSLRPRKAHKKRELVVKIKSLSPITINSYASPIIGNSAKNKEEDNQPTDTDNSSALSSPVADVSMTNSTYSRKKNTGGKSSGDLSFSQIVGLREDTTLRKKTKRNNTDRNSPGNIIESELSTAEETNHESIKTIRKKKKSNLNFVDQSNVSHKSQKVTGSLQSLDCDRNVEGTMKQGKVSQWLLRNPDTTSSRSIERGKKSQENSSVVSSVRNSSKPKCHVAVNSPGISSQPRVEQSVYTAADEGNAIMDMFDEIPTQDDNTAPRRVITSGSKLRNDLLTEFFAEGSDDLFG